MLYCFRTALSQCVLLHASDCLTLLFNMLSSMTFCGVAHFMYVCVLQICPLVLSLLRKAIDKELGLEARLEYSVIVDKGNDQTQPYTINLPTGKSGSPKSTNGQPNNLDNPFDLKSLDQIQQKSHLNPHYTFNSFIEGDCNRLARSAGFAVAAKPGVTSSVPVNMTTMIGYY